MTAARAQTAPVGPEAAELGGPSAEEGRQCIPAFPSSTRAPGGRRRGRHDRSTLNLARQLFVA